MEHVTCIIPVRNGENTIARAIQSALDAGCDEVLVFDDGSTDKTDQISFEMELSTGGKVRAVSLGQPTRCGVTFARNYLIEEAEDGLIIPLDCDDVLMPIAPLVRQYEQATWVYGDYIQNDRGVSTRVNGFPSGTLNRKNITGVTFLFSKQDWKSVGGYDPDFAYAEDYAFQCALVNAGIKPVHVDHILYHRYLHDGGNERTTMAGLYWAFYRDMARMKYPNAFNG